MAHSQHSYRCNRYKKTISIIHILLHPPLNQNAISSHGTTENGRGDKERKEITIDVLFLYLLSYRKQQQNTNQPTPHTEGGILQDSWFMDEINSVTGG